MKLGLRCPGGTVVRFEVTARFLYGILLWAHGDDALVLAQALSRLF